MKCPVPTHIYIYIFLFCCVFTRQKWTGVYRVSKYLILIEKVEFCNRKTYSITHFLKQLGTLLF